MSKGGAILLARKIIDSDIWQKPDAWYKIWNYILFEVNHTDGHYKRGTGLFRWPAIKGDLPHTTEDQWHKCVKWLKQTTQITTRKTTRGNIISVVNYGKYQDFGTYRATRKATTEAKQEQHRSNTIRNNDNNETNNTGKFKKPTPEEVKEYCKQRKNSIDPLKWFNYYESNGWRVGKNPMKNWQAAVRTWENNGVDKKQYEKAPEYKNITAERLRQEEEQQRKEHEAKLKQLEQNGLDDKYKSIIKSIN